jgi:hypothetical protein
MHLGICLVISANFGRNQCMKLASGPLSKIYRFICGFNRFFWPETFLFSHQKLFFRETKKVDEKRVGWRSSSSTRFFNSRRQLTANGRRILWRAEGHFVDRKFADFSSKKSPAYRRLINDISPTYRQKIDTYRRKKSPTICRIIAYLSPIYILIADLK